MDSERRKEPFSTTERVYRNELPDKAAVINEISHSQKRHFSQTEIEQMIKDYTEQHLSVYQLAEKYGCHRNTISSRLKKNGVTVAKSCMNDELVAEAQRLYESGMTLKAVGEQLNVSEETVRRALKNSAVKIRKPHRYTNEERAETKKQAIESTPFARF